MIFIKRSLLLPALRHGLALVNTCSNTPIHLYERTPLSLFREGVCSVFGKVVRFIQEDPTRR